MVDILNVLIDEAARRCRLTSCYVIPHPEYIDDIAAEHALRYIADEYGVENINHATLGTLRRVLEDMPELVNDECLIIIMMAHLVYQIN